MNPKQFTTKQMVITAIVAGLTGGALLILKSILVRNGYLDIAIFALVMLATFISILVKKYVDVTFKKWLVTGIFTFTSMSCVMYAYILIYDNPGAREIPFLGHLWRFAAIVGCGALCSAILGLFLLKRNSASIKFS